MAKSKVIKSMKEKLDNADFGDAIPFGADAENIDLADGHNLEETLGGVKVEEKGTVQKQLDNHDDDLKDITNTITWGSI